jgi:NAD(P)-dependent dehydrogenase (short-subunit alcohol dehydrogenase family)
MELESSRILVVGATGVLGRLLTAALVERGARVAVTGRDAGRLAEVADEGVAVAYELDLLDVEACRAVVDRAADDLGGLDALVVASGVAAFGEAREASDAVAEELFAVNTLAPIALCGAAAALIGRDGRDEQDQRGGGIVVLSAILADAPMAGMAAYSASKAAVSAYLAALRREVRRQGIAVLDVRPPHMDTGLVDRALAGAPPKLPPGQDPAELVAAVVRGLEQGARELVWDPTAKALALH